MVEEAKKLSAKDFPQNSLGRVFPDFEIETRKEGLTSYNSELGLGILARFIGENFYLKFRSREYVSEQREFVDEFLAETETEKTTGSDKGGKTTQGDTSKFQVLGKGLTDKNIQHGTVSSFDQKGTNIIHTHKGVNYAPLVTEEEYEEIMEPDKPKPKKLGTDPYELLAKYEKTKNWADYLEALKAYHDQNEKE
ncbi:1478_t:CDS:2 [Entrophospora sp. SA101]|nr:1478_t:CDS:2 [Entrophospora sp. SA101]